MSYVRETAETYVAMSLKAGERPRVETPIPFLTHMLETFLLYAGLGGTVEAREKRRLDDGHHLIEDVAIALGRALDQMLGDRGRIARFGWAAVPMDDAFALAAVDLGGRAYCVVKAKLPPVDLGGYPLWMFPHWVCTLASEARATIHVYTRGRDPHHKVEAVHKALGLAFRQAMSPGSDVLSTKGVLG